MNQKIAQLNNYLLYARKSSESAERQALSIESQIREMKAVADRSGFEIGEIREESHSAKNPEGRPIFNQILLDIESGRIQKLLVWNIDRLSRNSIDSGRIIHLVDSGKLQEIATPGQIFRNTPNDKFMLNLFFSQAKLENDHKGVNVKRGLAQKAQMGWCPNMGALGYTYNPMKRKGEKEIMNDPASFDLVKKMWQMVLSGKYSVKETYDLATKEWGLTNKNGGKVAIASWYAMLHNPFYYGWFEFPKGSSNWIQGKHEAMISREDFEKIQDLLSKKGTTRPKSYTFAYTGIIQCANCGAMITAENKTKKNLNGNKHHYIYYHCTKRRDPNCPERKNVEEKVLEDQIQQLMKTIDIPPGFKDFAIHHLRQNYSEELESDNRIREGQSRALESSKKKLSRLIDMKLNGELSEADFSFKQAELHKEQELLTRALTSEKTPQETWLEKLEKTLNVAEEICKRFKGGDLRNKKQVVASLGTDLILKNSQFTIGTENPILRIKKVAEVSSAIYKKMEPLKPDKKKLEIAYSTSPKLQAGLKELAKIK
ncbi:MAG: recombinase family protein [Parcubacteria group bacterium]